MERLVEKVRSLALYAKGVAAAVGTLGSTLYAALEDGGIDVAEANAVWAATLAVTALVVRVPNRLRSGGKIDLTELAGRKRQ